MQILETYVQPREESFSIPGITITNFHKITAGLRAVSYHTNWYIRTRGYKIRGGMVRPQFAGTVKQIR